MDNSSSSEGVFQPLIYKRDSCCYTVCQSKTARDRTRRKACIIASKGLAFIAIGAGLLISGLLTKRSKFWIPGVVLLGIGVLEIVGVSAFACRNSAVCCKFSIQYDEVLDENKGVSEQVHLH